jgi:hypothetical protein
VTDQALDALLYRADTCPQTLSSEEACAAKRACQDRGWTVPDALKVVLVTRLIAPDNAA